GLDELPVARPLRRAVGVARAWVLVVHERHAVADEHAVADPHAGADERVRRDLAVVADRRAALDLDERADPRAGAEPAAVEVDELVHRRPLAEDHVGRDGLEPLAHRMSPTPLLGVVTRRDAFLMAAIVGVLAITTIAFGERIGVNAGQGWDGMSYTRWAVDFPTAVVKHGVSPYEAQRVLPSAIVHARPTAGRMPAR